MSNETNSSIRSIIKIDLDKCNGCGVCVPDCPEGALQIIDGKARLVSDYFCDGLGACIGSCPQGAILVEKRQAEPYDEKRVMENIIPQGINVIIAHLSHLYEHGEGGLLAIAENVLKDKGIAIPRYKNDAGHAARHSCPGSASMELTRKNAFNSTQSHQEIDSELTQWPVQLKLLNPSAPYFENANLLIAADCTPVSYGDFHRRFLKERKIALFCPKLDSDISEYIDKLSTIIKDHNINSIKVARMEVPCCGGVTAIAKEAIKRSGKNLKLDEEIITIQGDVAHGDN
jgi:ferredoxin